MTNVYLLLFLISQSFVAVSSGEVTLRFLAWYYSIVGQRVKLAPMILGVAFVCGALCAMEIEWMTTEVANSTAQPNIAIHGFHGPWALIEAFTIRFFLFVGVCSLNYPVLTLYNPHERQFKMLWLIKLFIVLCSAYTGVLSAIVFWHHVCGC